MDHNYTKIERDIALNGLFSEYLPPCFKMDRSALCNGPSDPCDLIPPYSFTMSRFSSDGSRRSIYIPEVGAYVVTRNYIKQEQIIDELIRFTESSKNSFSPIIGAEDTIMMHEQVYNSGISSIAGNPSDYIENVAKKIIKAAGSTRVLKLDIANCYASFYTHMVPAILLGFERANQEYSKTLSRDDTEPIDPIYTKYANLDKVIRQQNLNRTNGILTGPLYSRIIIEAILTRIDIELKEAGLSFSRYSDDYEVYLRTENVDTVISTFETILKRYNFSLNYEKKQLVDFPYYVIENLSKLFSDHSEGKLQTEELMSLFDTFQRLEKDGTKGAIRFLLKSIETKPIDTENPELYKAYLLTILASNERSLVKGCSILIEHQEKLCLTNQDVELITQMLNNHIQCGHDLETIWLLYLLIMTNNLLARHIDLILDGNNELAQTILLCKNLLTTEQSSELARKVSSWLRLYELYATNSISETDFMQRLNLRNNLSMYQRLKNRNAHFCTFL